MLYWHNQTEHYWPAQTEHYHQYVTTNGGRDMLPLPLFKHEDSALSSDHDASAITFQYVLGAATSPAVKLHEETLTYLNQGQSYEIRMICNQNMRGLLELNGKMLKSIVRVVFHDRRLQYSEHQQFQGWKWSRPGDRLLDIDIPLSVGIVDPRVNPTLLNAAEFFWDPKKQTSVSIQVHCISTEFTPRKNGGEKGVPFRIQIDTFKLSENGDYTEHLHSASCQVKVFKPKGADRKLKTDKEKIEKRSPQERSKYQPAYETTVLTEELFISKPSGGWISTEHDGGADLLKLSRDDIIQICGPADGIRLFNTLRLRSIRPRLTIYMCEEPTQGKEKEDCQDSPNAAMCVYKEIYLEDLTKAELTNKLAALFSISPSQILQIYRQGAAGIHILVGDQMIRNLPDESSFIINSLKVDSLGGYYMILK